MSDNHGWQPIETAPRDGTEILCYGLLQGSYGYSDDVWCNDIVWWAGESWHSLRNAHRYVGGFRPTRWQPLPPPPEERR